MCAGKGLGNPALSRARHSPLVADGGYCAVADSDVTDGDAMVPRILQPVFPIAICQISKSGEKPTASAANGCSGYVARCWCQPAE